MSLTEGEEATSNTQLSLYEIWR